MNIVFMSMDTLPSTLWARDLYDQMHIRSDFRKWFPRMCQYGFIEGRDYEYGVPHTPRSSPFGRTIQRSLSASRIRGTIFFTNRCNFWKNRIMGESYLSSCKAKNSRKDG